MPRDCRTWPPRWPWLSGINRRVPQVLAFHEGGKRMRPGKGSSLSRGAGRRPTTRPGGVGKDFRRLGLPGQSAGSSSRPSSRPESLSGARTEGVEAVLDARKACIEERSAIGNGVSTAEVRLTTQTGRSPPHPGVGGPPCIGGRMPRSVADRRADTRREPQVRHGRQEGLLTALRAMPGQGIS